MTYYLKIFIVLVIINNIFAEQLSTTDNAISTDLQKSAKFLPLTTLPNPNIYQFTWMYYFLSRIGVQELRTTCNSKNVPFSSSTYSKWCKANDLSGYIEIKALKNQVKFIRIFARGSIHALDYLADIQIKKQKVNFGSGIASFHTGFLVYGFAFYESVKEALSRVPNINDYEIYFIGHSLGGAKALVASWFMSYDSEYRFSQNQLKVIACGAPKVFGLNTIHPIGDYNILRINVKTDPVPYYPTSLMGYGDVGIEVKLDSGAKSTRRNAKHHSGVYYSNVLTNKEAFTEAITEALKSKTDYTMNIKSKKLNWFNKVNRILDKTAIRNEAAIA